MTTISKILTGAAGFAALMVVASPAAAQGYYGQYPQPQQGVVGAIINSVTGGGYGQYPQGNYGYGQVNERAAVGQCAAAAEQRLNRANRAQSGYGYGNQGYNGYPGQGYSNGYGQARVVGITNVERRGNGKLRVTGLATSGQGYAYGNQGYGNGRYQGGYTNAQADLRFTCKVDYSGRVTEVKINRQTAYNRGY
jgi:hypothetical protein